MYGVLLLTSDSSEESGVCEPVEPTSLEDPTEPLRAADMERRKENWR